MISFEKYTLSNGLRVILHKDENTPIAALSIVYDVGSRDEHPEHTGFAHLFEHLMFGGSMNIPDFDAKLQQVGGENNAFTNTDITNYYLTVPLVNLETALWMESDRMNELAFSEKSLDIQKKVVIEEFKQSYLNQAYGDVNLLLKPLAYKVHPYQWNTIGKNPEHIKQVNMSEVKDFFHNFYKPNNAVLSIAGNIDFDNTIKLIEKWFGDIKKGRKNIRNLPSEPKPYKAKFMEVERDVPNDLLIKAFHTCKRNDEEFYASDLISDIFSNGKSARLQQHLVEEQHIFSNITTYVNGTFDEGLFIINGNPNEGVSLETADAAIDRELDLLCSKKIEEKELQKVKNKVQTMMYYTDLQVQDKAMNLGIFEVLDKAERYNSEDELYQSVSAAQILETSRRLFTNNNSITLYYKSIKNKN